jgi:hypothetical protein
MGLPIYKTFTEEQLKTYKPFAGKADEFSTKIRVYQTPFMYENVAVGDFYEIDVMKGIEFKADTGFITITEDRPIVGVTVVGSGCVPRGYNIVEWWEEGESIDNVNNRTVKRLRVDNLNGVHPSVWIHILAKVPFLVEQFKNAGIPFNYDHVAGKGVIKDDYDLLKKLSLGFYENLPLAFFENSVHFAVGHSPVVKAKKFHEESGNSFTSVKGDLPELCYPRKITIRCGCKEPEDPGSTLERYPGDYAIRLVQVHVIG